MLKTTQEFLTTSEVGVLRKWLGEPGARLFRKLLHSRVHENQIEATQKFSDRRERMDEDGRLLMNKSKIYRETLAVMDEFSDETQKPYTVKIIDDQ